VLDRLLEEPWLRIAGISGTSAGAMNAAVLADGWTEGGAEGARTALEKFWQRVSRAAAFSPLQRSPIDRLMGRWTLDTSPGYVFMDLISRVLSPYALNPLDFNPLRRILTESVDCDRLTHSPIKLFITATSVRTGRGRIFRNSEINPRERSDTPRSAPDILNRLNEISFNSPLMKELRMIALLRQVADPGTGEGGRWAEMRTHRIMTDMLARFGASSKLNAEWEFIAMLRSEGRRAASEFLDANGKDLGKRSTADLDVLLAEC